MAIFFGTTVRMNHCTTIMPTAKVTMPRKVKAMASSTWRMSKDRRLMSRPMGCLSKKRSMGARRRLFMTLVCSSLDAEMETRLAE